MSYVADTLSNLIHQTAFFNLTWGNYLMILAACVFLYLAIRKGFEPLAGTHRIWYASGKYLSWISCTVQKNPPTERRAFSMYSIS